MPGISKARALKLTGRVTAQAALERVHGAGQVPRTPRDITAQWLSGALAPHAPGVRVRSVRALGGSAGTTTRQALEIAYAGDAEELPRWLFVKCTAGLGQRLMLGLGGLIEGEPGFYNHVRPSLEIEAPAGYFGAVDPRSWRSIVVTEDVVRTRDASFWAPGRRTSQAEIEDLLGNLARWHGALWGSPRLESWRWLKTPAEQMQVIDALIGLANRLPAGARRAREAIPPRLRHRQDDLFAGLRRSMHAASRGPQTYLHGDLHIANTYRTGTGRMGVADWQVGLKGAWSHDYAYLLATALEVEDRRAWERELLEFYLDRLGAAGGAAIPPEQAWQSYREGTLYPYFAWLYTIGRSRLQPSFQPPEVGLTMIARIAAAIDDLDSLGAVGL